MARHPGDSAVLTTILNTMSNKEKDYKSGIVENVVHCNNAAERVSVGGELEEALLAANKDSNGNDIIPEEEIKAFFAEQRDKVKAIAVQNVERFHHIDTFMGAINNLKQQPAAPEGSNYEKTIKDFMEVENERTKQSNSDIQKHKIVREVKQKLGEQDDSAAQGDDDIEVVRNNNSNVSSFKCPFLGTWMENAVKNTVCGHCYSKEGIENHIRNKNKSRQSQRPDCPCPYPGCTNSCVTKEQIEDDPEMCRLVKRHKRREEIDREKQAMSQAMMDDDDEEEMM